jgi:hypothetical protein
LPRVRLVTEAGLVQGWHWQHLHSGQGKRSALSVDGTDWKIRTMSVDYDGYIRWMLDPKQIEQPLFVREMAGKYANNATIAAFSVATQQALGESPSLREIQDLVQKIQGTYVESELLPAAQAEAVIRGSYDEQELLENMPYTDLVRSQLSLTYGIVRVLNLENDDYDTFVAEAAQVAEELLS